jgi:hypothetical protein
VVLFAREAGGVSVLQGQRIELRAAYPQYVGVVMLTRIRPEAKVSLMQIDSILARLLPVPKAEV